MAASIEIKISPENLAKWSNMEDWAENGTSAAPTGHVLTGSGATVARESTIIKQGTYSAAVARVGNDVSLYHDLPEFADYLGKKVTIGFWVYATVASRARISISDGVGSGNSSTHSGVAGWERLTVTRNLDEAATRLRIECHVITGNTTAYFDGGFLAEGDSDVVILTDYADIEHFDPSQRYRVEGFKVVRRDGTLVKNANFDDKTINLNGQVTAASAAACRTATDTLMKALHSMRTNPEQNTTKNHLSMWDERYLPVLISSLDAQPTASARIMKFKSRFTAVEPFIKFVNWTRSKTALSASPTSFTVTVAGNIYSMPIVTFTPSGSNMTACVLENLTTGDSMAYSDTVVDGDDLVIDCDLYTVENDGVDDIASHSGDFIRLLPGGNQMKFTGTTGGVLRIDWVDRWIL